MLYIYKYNEKIVYNTQDNQDIEHKKRARIQYLLYETLTETTSV